MGNLRQVQSHWREKDNNNKKKTQFDFHQNVLSSGLVQAQFCGPGKCVDGEHLELHTRLHRCTEGDVYKCTISR